MTVARIQSAFQFRTDFTAAQGGSPVWGAPQNVNYEPAADTPFRIRFQIENTGTTDTASVMYNLLVSKNGGAYAAVPTTSSGNPVFCVDATAGASADNSPITTSLLPGGAGTWVNGQYATDGATAPNILLTAGSYSEVEFGVQFNSAAIAAGDSYAFRVYFSSTSAFQIYSVTPVVNVPAYFNNFDPTTWRLNVGPGLYQGAQFGKGAYGVKNYSAGVFVGSPLTLQESMGGALPATFTLGASLELQEALAGVLQPRVTAAADLTLTPIPLLAGVLPVNITLVGDLFTGTVYLAGVLPLQLTMSGTLSLMQELDGVLPFSVSLQAALNNLQAMNGALVVSIAMLSPPDIDILIGPRWGEDQPCPPPLWGTDPQCPPPVWRQDFYGAVNTPRPYGLANYGEQSYGMGLEGVLLPPPWVPSEGCDA